MTDNPRNPVNWDAAFAYYASLPPERRSRSRVASRFQVSPQRVSTVAVQRDWDARVAVIDRRARQRAETTIVRERSTEIAKTVEIVSLAEDELLKRLRAGQAEVRLADLPALVKLRELLLGGATQRIEVSEVRVALTAFLGVAIRHLPPERRQVFLAEAREATGGFLDASATAELEERDDDLDGAAA
jgi:hypothetical protein